MAYRGRFAPTPSGPLHAGSMVAALASWLDARAHGGTWLLRIDDVDRARCVPAAEPVITAQLAACGLVPDEPVVRQSARHGRYAEALGALSAAGLAYPCACSRRDIEGAQDGRRDRPDGVGGRRYPGTCRPERGGLAGRPGRAVRLRLDNTLRWCDRRLGAQSQDLASAVGDMVLRRADGLWAYQLATVVDDADAGITQVVRGEDLADSTPRQIALQRALGVGTPGYLHTPLLLGGDGMKLSKRHAAEAVDPERPLVALQAAARTLGLPSLGGTPVASVPRWLDAAVAQWAVIMPPLQPTEPFAHEQQQ